MTTPVEPIGLDYDGADLQPSDLSMLWRVVSGIDDAPEVRGQDVVIPYADGRVSRPRRFDRRVIVLEGFVRGTGPGQSAQRSAYRVLRRFLADLFDPAREPATLTVTLEDGSTYEALARPLPSLAYVEAVPSEFANGSVELEAVEDWTFTAAGS